MNRICTFSNYLTSEGDSVIATGLKFEEYLNCLVGTPLQYGIKRSDFDLFQLGFGDSISLESWGGQTLQINKYAIHFDSALYLYWKNRKVDKFYSDTQAEEFDMVLSKLRGKYVERIALSDKNDLWLDLEDCQMVIVTRDDDEESWRFFLPRTNQPHLVASSSTLILDGD